MDKQIWEQAVAFHGHECPGLAIGVRASLIALDQLRSGPSADEELVCVTENDACGVDGVQVLTGCTLGKGNLIYRPSGKMAFSFFNRTSGAKLRLYLIAAKGERSREEYMHFLLDAPAEQVFACSVPAYDAPSRAGRFASVTCELCGEAAPEPKMHLQDGKNVCSDCFRPYDRGW